MVDSTCGVPAVSAGRHGPTVWCGVTSDLELVQRVLRCGLQGGTVRNASLPGRISKLDVKRKQV